MQRRRYKIAVVTVVLAAWLGGCAMRESPREWPHAGRITQQDVEALNDAVALASRREYGRAETMLADLQVRFADAGDGVHAGEAMFWRGYCREKTGRETAAAEMYRRVLDEYPPVPAAEQALTRLEIVTQRGPADLAAPRESDEADFGPDDGATTAPAESGEVEGGRDGPLPASGEDSREQVGDRPSPDDGEQE